MYIKALALTALASSVGAQSLTAVLANQSSLSNLTTYLGLFPALVQQLSSLTNITLLAPNNAAFSKLANSSINLNDTSFIQALFTYHALNGSYANFSSDAPTFIPSLLQSPVYSNVTGGQVVEAVSSGNTTIFYSGLHQNVSSVGSAITFDGGVIHIIDSLLTVPENISTTAVQANLRSAVGALLATNLAATLDGLSDVTVFLPVDSAFEAIGGTLGTLSAAQIAGILEYHVINGTVAYSSLLSNESVPTLEGADVKITLLTVDNETAVFVDSARVLVPDVLVANGVVHIIDAVLNPNNATATPVPTATSPPVAFAGASSATAEVLTSGIPSAVGSLTIATTAAAPATAVASSAASAASSSGAAGPARTAAVGMGALFGGAALVMNL